MQMEKERYMTLSALNNLDSNRDKLSSSHHNNPDSLSNNQSNENRMKVDSSRATDQLLARLSNQNHLQQVLDESQSESSQDLLSAAKIVDSIRSRTTSLSKNSDDDPYRR